MSWRCEIEIVLGVRFGDGGFGGGGVSIFCWRDCVLSTMVYHHEIVLELSSADIIPGAGAVFM
jgi:hypothetical protein